MINGIRQLSNIPALSSFSSKRAYSIPSTTKSSAVAANGSSVLLAPSNYSNNFPSSSGLPIPPQNGQKIKRSNNKYPETLVTAMQEGIPAPHLRLITNNSQNLTELKNTLISRVDQLAQQEFGRQLPEKGKISTLELGELIQAYHVAISNRTALESRGILIASKGEQMKEIALNTLGEKDFQNLSQEQQLDYFIVTGNTPEILALIKAQENNIVNEARLIPNSSQNQDEFNQFKASLSKLVEYLVGINNIKAFARQGSLI